MLDLKCHIPAGLRVACAERLLQSGLTANAVGPWHAHVYGRGPEELGNGFGKSVPHVGHTI